MCMGGISSPLFAEVLSAPYQQKDTKLPLTSAEAHRVVFTLHKKYAEHHKGLAKHQRELAKLYKSDRQNNLKYRLEALAVQQDA